MLADATGIGDIGAAGDQIALISINRVFDGCRPAGVGIGATSELARLALRLPKGENRCAVGLLVVVGERDSLGPVAAAAVGYAHDPRSGRMVAAVAERDTG